jgi:CHASE2 domain-containing sensor protein
MGVKKKLLIAAGTAIFVIVSFCLHLLVPSIGKVFYDLNFSLPAASAPPDSVVIVGIDAASIAELGAFPWPRSMMAALVERISTAQPRVIALDFEFPKRDGAADNDSLAAVFSRVDNLVLPFRGRQVSIGKQPLQTALPAEAFNHRFLIIRDKEQLAGDLFYSAGQIDISDPLFAQYADRGGFINVATSRAGQAVRELIHVVRAGDEYYPSFGLSSAAAFLRVKPSDFVLAGGPVVMCGNRTLPLSSYAGTYVNFRGHTGSIPTIAAVEVLQGAIDPARLRDKLVFVGMTDPGSAADFFITPVGTQFPGVEMWATVAADIIEGTWVRPAGIALTIANILMALLLFPGLSLLIPARLKWLAIGCGLAILLLSVGISLIAFSALHMIWNPEYHLYGWLFSLMWLAALSMDPTLVEVAPLELEPGDAVGRDSLPPPHENDLLGSIPPTPTMVYVLKKIGVAMPQDGTVEPQRTLVEQPMPADSGLVTSIRDLDGSQIVRLLGSGGMADVYLVWNPRMEVYRAVKVIKPDQSAQLLDRFETEIKIFAGLSHSNIVQCFTAGYWHGLPYLEMEFVAGISMDTVLKKCTLITPEQTMAIGILVCRSLHYAHRQNVTIHGKTYNGVIHRDLKPANIMLSRSGRIKLTDFGIARPTAVSIHTGDAGKVVGTLPYLAPEQLDGKGITAKSDIYALGATLYELVTGVRAFPQTEIATLISAKSKGEVKPLSQTTYVPAEFAAIVHKAMANNPEQRFATAQDMGAAIETVLRKHIKTDHDSPLMGLTKRFWG